MATLPGYRIRIADRDPDAWRDVRSPRFLIGSSPHADLVVDGAHRHARLELGDDGLVVRALGGAVRVDGVAILAAPLGAAARLALGDGFDLDVARGDDWEPPAAAVAALAGDAPLRRLALAALAAAGPRLAIEGDPGAGATTAARALHAARRPGGPLVEVDCAGDVDTVEPRLFGAAMGRLGLAAPARPAAFAEARGGTLVLDRVDSLDPSLHTRLIAALDRADDVAVIATCRDLDTADLPAPLHDRLAAARAWLPPLAAMASDLLGFARRFAADAGIAADLPRDLPRILSARPWRGNLAELRRFVARLAAP